MSIQIIFIIPVLVTVGWWKHTLEYVIDKNLIINHTGDVQQKWWLIKFISIQSFCYIGVKCHHVNKICIKVPQNGMN